MCWHPFPSIRCGNHLKPSGKQAYQLPEANMFCYKVITLQPFCWLEDIWLPMITVCSLLTLAESLTLKWLRRWVDKVITLQPCKNDWMVQICKSKYINPLSQKSWTYRADFVQVNVILKSGQGSSPEVYRRTSCVQNLNEGDDQKIRHKRIF